MKITNLENSLYKLQQHMLKKENLSLEEQTNLKDLQLKYKNIYISRAEGAFIHYWKNC